MLSEIAMIWKDLKFKDEFWLLDPKLRVILCRIDLWAFARGEFVTITDLIRAYEQQAELYAHGFSKFPPGQDIHEYGRAGDIRPFVDEKLNEELPIWVNAEWPYDPERPHLVTCYDERGAGGGGHWHIQVMATQLVGA